PPGRGRGAPPRSRTSPPPRSGSRKRAPIWSSGSRRGSGGLGRSRAPRRRGVADQLVSLGAGRYVAAHARAPRALPRVHGGDAVRPSGLAGASGADVHVRPPRGAPAPSRLACAGRVRVTEGAGGHRGARHGATSGGAPRQTEADPRAGGGRARARGGAPRLLA